MKALDKVRGRTMTKAGISDRHAMWAVRKNPADLTCEQRTSLASITTTNNTLYRAYLLKEQLREVFRVKGQHGRQLLAGWLAWALAFPHLRVRRPLARSIRLLTADPDLEHPRPQRQQRPLLQAIDTHLRALTKRAYGYHSPRGPDRHGHAHPRRSLPGATRPKMTHYNV